MKPCLLILALVAQAGVDADLREESFFAILLYKNVNVVGMN